MRTATLLWILLAVACRTPKVTYSTDFDDIHMFGDRRDAGRGVRVLCWPTDAEGNRFRFVEDRIDKNISEQPVSTWPGAELPGPAGSVTVVLPPQASDVLRVRAGKLCDELTRGSPWAGRHLVTADTSWEAVAGGRDLALHLRYLHDTAKTRRATESDDGLFLTWSDLSGVAADAIIVPVEGEDRHLVLQGVRRNMPARPAGGDAVNADAQGRDGFVVVPAGWQASSREFLSLEQVRNLPVPEGEHRVCFEVVFRDGDETARERAMRLAAELIARPRTSAYLRPIPDPVVAKGSLPEGFEPAYVHEGLPVAFVVSEDQRPR